VKRIAVLGDVHDHRERLDLSLDLLPESVELAILVGDIGIDPPWSPEGRAGRREAHDSSVRAMIARVRERLGARVVFVPGNHDLPDAADTAGDNADGLRLAIDGLRISGLGGAGPGRFGFPYEWDEPEADARLAGVLAGTDACDVLVSHTPPADTSLDRTLHGLHVGSVAVARWIERARPRLFLCGHIHEAWGVERLHGVPCVNAGAMGQPFGQPIAWLVDWDGGPRRIRSFRLEHGTRTSRLW